MKYLREKEVAAMTGLPVQSLRNHRHRGVGIPYHKLGRVVAYAESDVVRFMEAHRVQTEPLGGPGGSHET
jgi:predicted DNA-binding transcriptional regulator AlpA